MINVRVTLSGFLAALALFQPRAGHAQGIEDPKPSKFYLSPDKADAGKAFVMSTLNPDLHCTLIYYGQSVSVGNGRIDLYFKDSTSGVQTVLCVLRDFGPSFSIPALKAGEYQVYVSQLYSCPKGTVCPLVIIPQYAGILTVGSSAALASSPRVSARPGVGKALSPGRVPWRGESSTVTGRWEERR